MIEHLINVKPLEWNLEEENWWSTQPAVMLGGAGYEVRVTDRGQTRIRLANANRWTDFEGSSEDGKAYCQQDFERRVLTAIQLVSKIDSALVEKTAKALEKFQKQTTYGWSDDTFEVWWNEDPYFIERVDAWGWFKGTRKDKCLFEASVILQAALNKPPFDS